MIQRRIRIADCTDVYVRKVFFGSSDGWEIFPNVFNVSC